MIHSVFIAIRFIFCILPHSTCLETKCGLFEEQKYLSYFWMMNLNCGDYMTLSPYCMHKIVIKDIPLCSAPLAFPPCVSRIIYWVRILEFSSWGSNSEVQDPQNLHKTKHINQVHFMVIFCELWVAPLFVCWVFIWFWQRISGILWYSHINCPTIMPFGSTALQTHKEYQIGIHVNWVQIKIEMKLFNIETSWVVFATENKSIKFLLES